jgi:beta-lactamase superfamily II metal-dependent hydrolase
MIRFLALAALGATLAAAQTPAAPLQVYFIDVEGGQSTLFVTPDHHSLLIDTGWPGNNGRDADRIVAAAHQAGLTRIDDVLITHFHEDHVGGVPQLLARIPVGTLIDHGVNREDSEPGTHAVYAAYQKVLASPNTPHRIVAHLGETLPIQGLEVQVVSVDGQLLTKPLPGAGAPNSACAQTEVRPTDLTENARSLGVVIHYGKATLVDLGDLTWDKERPLMCPNNLLGHADVYIVSHHGWDHSGSPAFVHGLAPRLAIMDNGATKGGSPAAWKTIESSPGLEALWQLHYAEAGGPETNVPDERIANIKGGSEGNYLKLSVSKEGSLTLYNSRTGLTKSYAAP